MELKLYNTLTRKKEVFTPLDPKNVRMYVCGPTVYDYAHIGNARPVIVFDVLFRLLHYMAKQGVWDGGKGETQVTYVRNITDIDDKIIARAHELRGERNVPIAEVMREVTEKTYAQYHEDVAALGCLPPTHEPRATEHIPQMIAMIEKLIASGHAYARDGHVLYDVASKPDYGKLANRSVDEMIAGARVDVAPYKKGPMDFVLWKPSDAETPGWDSPWGRGRPGWHIECSAMGKALLGETFDIHGGGIDLVFPHHENEIAQSEGAHHGHPLAHYWTHNGFLQVEGEKMSKSLGNFVTIADELKDWPGEVIHFNMLRTHYRQPIDWTEARLLESWRTLDKWVTHFGMGPATTSPAGSIAEGDGGNEAENGFSGVLQALCDDLNTPQAIGALHRITEKGELLLSLSLMGIDLQSYADTQKRVVEQTASFGKTVRLIQMRNEARKAKDFKRADEIRAELDAMGIQLKDSKDPQTGEIVTTWELKR